MTLCPHIVKKTKPDPSGPKHISPSLELMQSLLAAVVGREVSLCVPGTGEGAKHAAIDLFYSIKLVGVQACPCFYFAYWSLGLQRPLVELGHPSGLGAHIDTKKMSAMGAVLHQGRLSGEYIGVGLCRDWGLSWMETSLLLHTDLSRAEFKAGRQTLAIILLQFSPGPHSSWLPEISWGYTLTTFNDTNHIHWPLRKIKTCKLYT